MSARVRATRSTRWRAAAESPDRLSAAHVAEAIQCRPEVEEAWWRVPPAGPGPLAALPEAVGAGP
jgi:hypothetical protein